MFPHSADPRSSSGVLSRIVRYPVKSMRGEDLLSAVLTTDGLEHDRLYAFESEAAPPGMLRVSGRERQQLLRFQARQTQTDVTVTTPDGKDFAVDHPELMQHLPGFSRTWLTREETPQTDCRPLALISLQTVRYLGQQLGVELDPLRFRANLYLDVKRPFAEDDWVGQTLLLGAGARVQILERDPRCRFITLDPITTEPMPELMQLLHRHHQGRAGVYARVRTPGPIRLHDQFTPNISAP